MNRTLLLGAAWTASAGAAVGLGFLAVSLVDASASPAVQPVASSAVPTATDSSSPSTSAAPVPSGEQVTPGGTVFANCSSGSPVLAGVPAAGWWPDDSQEPGTVEFKSATQKIEIRVTCVGGVPHFAVEGPRAVDNSGGGHSGGDDASATPAAPSTSDAPDDSDGRIGGGHGSDDGPGDDHGGSNSGSGSGNSGSGNSGSGSDDSGSGGHGSDG
jgi:hypothetical protein